MLILKYSMSIIQRKPTNIVHIYMVIYKKNKNLNKLIHQNTCVKLL